MLPAPPPVNVVPVPAVGVAPVDTFAMTIRPRDPVYKAVNESEIDVIADAGAFSFTAPVSGIPPPESVKTATLIAMCRVFTFDEWFVTETVIAADAATGADQMTASPSARFGEYGGSACAST